MSLPFLLLAAAMIFALGSAGIAASLSAIEARRDAWSRRGPSGRPFQWPADPAEDLAVGRAETRFSISSALAWAERPAEASHAVLADPWDHRSVRFEERPFLIPHRDEFADLVRGAPSGVAIAGLGDLRLDALGDLGAPGRSPDLLAMVKGGPADRAGLGDVGGEIQDALASSARDGGIESLTGVVGEVLDSVGGGAVGEVVDELANAAGEATGLPLDQISNLRKVSGGLGGLGGNESALGDLFSGDLGGSIGGLAGVGELSDQLAGTQNQVLNGAAQVMDLASKAVSPIRDTVRALADLSSEALKLVGLGKYADEIKETSKALSGARFDPFGNLYRAAKGR